MTPEQAARVVFISGMIEAGYVLVRASRGGLEDGTTYRSLWSIGLLTLGLAVFADFIPEVAGPFAILVLIAMIVRNRGELGKVISREKPEPAPRARASAPAPATPAPSSSSSQTV